MDRDIVDIPEVFRRAFDEEGWGERNGDDDNGGGGNGGGSGRPWWRYRWLWLALAAVALLLSFNWIVSTYIDWLWFSNLDFRNVWLIQWGVKVVSFVVFFAIAAFTLLVDWRKAFNTARRSGSSSRLQVLNLPGIGGLVTGMALFLAFIFASAGASQWGKLLLYPFRQPFGVDDPIFDLDLSFYLFELPVYRFLQGWFTPLLVITLVGVVALYLADNWVVLQRGRWQRPRNLTALRRHTAILSTIILLFWAAGYVLDIFELLYSPRGVAFGASYTDLQASLPALYVQLALTLLLAIVVAINVFRQFLRPLLVTSALWLAAVVILGNLYPTLLQRYVVEPNELSKERPFIQNNIQYTRLAFGLDEVDARPFGNVVELTNQDLLTNRETLQNARLWDPRPLQQTYAQLQELRPYYEFSSIDIDRYEIDGGLRQVMLAGRELNKENLPGQSWVNQKLEFTHGYGAVMNPVDQVTAEGRPNFFIKDLPPQSSVPIEIDRPEIYYGEMMNDVVFVNSGLEEFDFPEGTQNAYSHYLGEGGVELSNLVRRLAFALRFGESNLLLSDYIDSETRALLHRQIRDRVEQITPFLALDNDPYLVVADGRLVWMLDAYTLSRDFPYSTPTEQGLNYIRNAAKITIDAYDGSVNYYVAAPDDPFIQAYSQIFPGLFQPLEDMPKSLLEHIRYPMDLFSVQTRQYLKYHMEDEQVFYNQEDLWEIAQEVFETDQQPIEPYYVIMSLPDEEDTEFLLIEPYTPAGKNNMIAWLAARSDPPNYGELVAYELPKQELVFGPLQIEARIDQNPQISAQMSLWNQRGSRVIRGNLIVIPMGSSFLYIEPIYLLADASELPELKRVIVASGDRLAMRETLSDALLALVQAGPSVVEIVNDAADDGGAGSGAEVTSGDSVESPSDSERSNIEAEAGASGAGERIADPRVQELVESAAAHFEAAEAAQRDGDWSTYGEELEELRQDLEELNGLIDSS